MAPRRDPDEHVIAHMESLGWEMDVPRTIQHFIADIPSADAAAALAEELSMAGYETKHHLAPRSSTWSIQADLRQVVDIDRIREQRAEMEAAAARYDASYDGWGAAQA
jgi:hypothetical protein